jgi:acetyl esterase/lipase
VVDDSPFGTVVRPDDPREMVILYLRGNDSVDLASQLAELTRATVVCPRYRSTYPGAFEDVRAAYRHYKHAGPVALVGERMGAGLAAALLVYLRDLGAALPRCAVLVSALLDLTMRANSLNPRADVTRLRQLVADYAGGATLTNPLLSPLYANLHGLSPIQLLVAGTDPLLDDSLAFATRAARDGVTVDLRVAADDAALDAGMLTAAADFLVSQCQDQVLKA